MSMSSASRLEGVKGPYTSEKVGRDLSGAKEESDPPLGFSGGVWKEWPMSVAPIAWSIT
jgi:hypothetical protein